MTDNTDFYSFLETYIEDGMKTRKGRHILWDGLEREQASCDRQTDGQTDTLLYLLTTSPSARLPAHISVLVRIATIHNIFRSLESSGSQSVGRGSSGTRKVIRRVPKRRATSLQISVPLSYRHEWNVNCRSARFVWRQTVNTSVEQFDAHTKQLTDSHCGHYTRQ